MDEMKRRMLSILTSLDDARNLDDFNKNFWRRASPLNKFRATTELCLFAEKVRKRRRSE